MYKLATDEAYGFLYCELISKDMNKRFMIKLNQYLTIEDHHLLIREILTPQCDLVP